MPQYMNHLFRLATRSPARSEMTSARIEVPTGVERIILSLSNGSSEVQELRRRVKDVEESNDALTYQLNQLQVEYNELQTRCITLATELQRTQRGNQDEVQNSVAISLQPPSSSLHRYPFRDDTLGILALCHGSHCRYINKARALKHAPWVTIVIKAETCWTDFPRTAFAVKPDRRFTKKGHWQDCDKQLLRRFPTVELLTCREDTWYYLGQYTVTAKDTISADEIKTLPQELGPLGVLDSGWTQEPSSQLMTMLEEGQLSGMRFTLERTSFNHVLAAQLIESLRRLGLVPAEGGATAADSDDIDDGQ
ncbi:hypothetical protein C8Q72DRAFT_274839 [Fomitopsis betulina]|nr:hypothetical protein C8Q72DRAFT_274839 [Fomitopsis betulina]